MAFGFRLQTTVTRGVTSAVAVAVLAGCVVAAQQTAPAHHRAQFHFDQPLPINFDDHDGWTQIFDGKSLSGWDGDPDVWHVEDGAIVGV